MYERITWTFLTKLSKLFQFVKLCYCDLFNFKTFCAVTIHNGDGTTEVSSIESVCLFAHNQVRDLHIDTPALVWDHSLANEVSFTCFGKDAHKCSPKQGMLFAIHLPLWIDISKLHWFQNIFWLYLALSGKYMYIKTSVINQCN